MRNISKKMSQILDERIVSKMKCTFLILFVVAASAAFLCAPAVGATIPVLGTAQDFAVLGHTGVSNTGPTVVFGSAITLANVGVYQDPGANAISGFNIAGNTFVGSGTFTDGPGLVNFPSKIYGKDGVSLQARNDLITAYNALALVGATGDLTGQILGNGVGGVVPTLGPGVYTFSSSAQLNGTLKLDAGGIDGVFWVFQIGSTLTTASASAVQLINPGGNLGSDVGVFWVVGSSATLGTTTAFEGNILALTDITLKTGATIYNGRALAQNGAIVLDTNVISDICPSALALPGDVTSGSIGLAGSSSPNSGSGFSGGLGFDTTSGQLVPIPLPPAAIPEPGTFLLIGSGLAGLVAFRKRSKKA